MFNPRKNEQIELFSKIFSNLQYEKYQFVTSYSNTKHTKVDLIPYCIILTQFKHL